MVSIFNRVSQYLKASRTALQNKRMAKTFIHSPDSALKMAIKNLKEYSPESFDKAVKTIQGLKKRNYFNQEGTRELIENVEVLELPIVWKLTFLLEINVLDEYELNESFSKLIFEAQKDIEEYRKIHGLYTKIYRRMGGKALSRYQRYTKEIEALRLVLNKIKPTYQVESKVISPTKDKPLKVACIIATWPRKTDSTHMGVVYLLKNLVEHQGNSFHLIISAEAEFYSPFGRLTALSTDIQEAHKTLWHTQGGDPNQLYSNLNLSKDPLTQGVSLIDTLEHIETIEPDMLLFIGGPYESILTRELLFPYFPTCVVPTSIKGTPVKGFDGIIATSDEANNKFKQKFKNETYQVPKPFRLFQNNESFDGWFPEIKSDNTIVATVLGGNRIEKSLMALSEKKLNTLASIFLTNPKLTWVLVGKTSMTNIAGLSEDFRNLVETKRIVYIEYINEIRSFLRKVDVFFVIPGMTGGGQCAQAAMFEQVAVICPDICDVAGAVPSDAKYETVEQCSVLFSTLAIADKLTDLKIRCKASVESNAIPHVAPQWEKTFCEIVAKGARRISSVSKSYNNEHAE